MNERTADDLRKLIAHFVLIWNSGNRPRRHKFAKIEILLDSRWGMRRAVLSAVRPN